jgi:NADPH2:quinone reductase
MVAAVRVHKVGGPEVLTYEEIDVPAPGAGQIRVKQHACGVNFVDVYFRMGLYPAPGGLPFVAGNEAAGEVVEVGPDVGEFKRGDRVAYVSGPGCYAAERVVATDRAVKLPANINYEQAAAMMLKGMTVEYLVRRTFKVERGMNVLMHAAAGGVGLILCQWANHLGATVIGTVGSDEKAKLAKANGCDHPIVYTREDFVERVKELTNGEKVSVVYDSIGKDTFLKSLDCLRPLGLMVCFGQASGPIGPVDLGIVVQKITINGDTRAL